MQAQCAVRRHEEAVFLRWREAGKGLPLTEFNTLSPEQFFILLIDEGRAAPNMPAGDSEVASPMADNPCRMIDVVGLRTGLAKTRLK